MALTRNQRDSIIHLANEAKRPGTDIVLYRETSFSGKSETLRYRKQWVERSQYGRRLRTLSSIVLSVTINVLPDGSDDPASWAKYRAKCEEAEALFNEIKHNDPNGLL